LEKWAKGEGPRFSSPSLPLLFLPFLFFFSSLLDSILSYSFPFLEAMMKVQKDSKISTKNLGRMNKDE
jgi:hypothetical protein